jgi:hypothetical protein
MRALRKMRQPRRIEPSLWGARGRQFESRRRDQELHGLATKWLLTLSSFGVEKSDLVAVRLPFLVCLKPDS